MKKRVLYLDILRIMACFGVIANHTNFILKRAEIAVASVSTVDYSLGLMSMILCKSAVTIFVMISGALLLTKVDSYKKIWKRIFRVGVVLVVFSAMYYCIGDYAHTPLDFIKTVTKQNVTTAFWYLYLYLGILVMLPMLQRMVTNFNSKDYWYFLFLSLYVCSFSFVTNYNQHFSIPIFATLVGVFVLGYYLDKVVDWNRFKSGMILGGSVAVAVVIIAFLYVYTYRKFMAGASDAFRLIVYDNVFYTTLSICQFVFVKKLVEMIEQKSQDNKNEKLYQGLSYIGSCTFGIYLFSDLFISILMPPIENMVNNMGGKMMFPMMLLLEVLVFLAGLVITAVLKKIPVVRDYI